MASMNILLRYISPTNTTKSMHVKFIQMLYLVDTNYSELDSLQYIFHDEEAGEFWIGGKIVAVENSYNWFVVCCQANDCNSRLIPLPSGEYECKKCLKNWTKGIDKYNLKLQLEDANGNAKLKLVDKDCIQLIGRTTSDFRAKHRRITPQLPKEIPSLVGLGMLFMVEVKREQLENRYAPFSVTKIINDQTLVSL
nr:putative transposase [Ipomoea trifida]